MDTKYTHRILFGDSRQMKEIADGEVQLVITSPPYWQLKDYDTQQQIGFHDDYSSYINNLNLVWQECHRVLEAGCRLCINIGDQFARAEHYGRYKVIPIRTEIIRFCEHIGFDYMGAIIWQKKTTTNTSGGATIMGSYPYPRNGVISIDYEFILLFKKLGKASRPNKDQKLNSTISKEEWKQYFQGHWNFGGARQKEHLATFPIELPHRLIKMFSFKGEQVLDPFLGSGTTSLAAKNLGRRSVGYEINQNYQDLIKGKLNLNEGEGVFLSVPNPNARFIKQSISELPYVYFTPSTFTKNASKSKINYGSKVNKQSKAREEYFTVVEILNGMKLKLNDGRMIELLGIKQRKDRKIELIAFLQERVLKKKVYIKLDNASNGTHKAVYLYLKNRTFINAHLVKNNLVVVDEAIEFRHKKRLLKYFEQAQKI